MYRIGKYEFDSEELLNEKIEALGEHSHQIVKLGHIMVTGPTFDANHNQIVDPTFSDKFHVDVLWHNLPEPADHPYGWKGKAIDLEYQGVHSFVGYDYFQYKL